MHRAESVVWSRMAIALGLLAAGSAIIAMSRYAPPPPAVRTQLVAVERCEASPIVRPPVAADLMPYWKHLPPSELKVDIALPRATIETTRGTLHCWLDPRTALATANFI